jgi:hypothetical protein
MKKNISIFLLLLMLLVITLSSCQTSDIYAPTSTHEPQITSPILEPTITATQDQILIPEPTPVDEIPPSPDPTPTEPAPTAPPTTSGQIAYIYNGNVWRYFVDSMESVQVTTDGVPGDYQNTYGRPAISPDGRYLAFNKDTSSWIQDLVTNTLIDISDYGQFFAWTGEGTQFFGVQGDFACPDIDNLEDQVLINFDILRFDLDDLPNPTLLANIGGGLKFMAAISGDGQWASIVHCACYSECGSENLWHLPSAKSIPPPIDLFPGYIDFSPDNTQLTVSLYQLYGYYQSPLYVANIDYTGMVEIFSDPSVAPIDAQWSPGGEWIAFTGVILTDDELVESDRCVRLIKPDGSQEYVVECLFANFLTWSPDGDQLLYSQRLGTQAHIFIYDLATSSRTKLPIQLDHYADVDWGRLQ